MTYGLVGIRFKMLAKEYMTNILKPLTSISSITSFRYHKISKHGERINLTTHPEMIDDVYAKKEIYNSGLVLPWDKYENSYCLTDPLIGNQHLFPIIHFIQNKYQLSHGCYIIKKTNDYCEIFHFLSIANNPNINNFYISHKELLEKFIFLFKQQSTHLMLEAEKNKFRLPHLASDRSSNPLSVGFNVKNLSKKLHLNSYALSNSTTGININLTKREFECLKLLTQGHRIKSIARFLNISSRTVEVHVMNLKKKFKCYNIAQLILRANDLFIPCLNG